MNYAEMRDKKISRKVALALGCKVRKSAFNTDYYFTDESKEYNHCAPSGPIEKFDPCNSWADAGPIIEKYRIGIENDGDCWLCVCFSENGSFESYHYNPLRAAMIVFLMMMESKND